MAEVCPISVHRIDSNLVRVISAQVVISIVLLLMTEQSIFAFILLFDFMMRTLRLAEFSPFHIISKFILTGWGIAPKLCDESPKRFALYLGLLVSLVLVVASMAGFMMFATLLAFVLLVCALLEMLFDFCIGCKIYHILQIGKGLFSNARNI
ncbi:MAG: DUF4395 domain-containing protein [Sulfurovum sp.]|nr:DUF4395 domain-containing protein [Sulfurovum sp.]